MSSRAALPTLDRTFIPRRLRRSHDQLVGCAGVSSAGCTPRDIKFVFRNFRYPASAPPGGCTRKMRRQKAELSPAETRLHEETPPSVRSFAVSPKGVHSRGISAISASDTPITGSGCTLGKTASPPQADGPLSTEPLKFAAVRRRQPTALRLRGVVHAQLATCQMARVDVGRLPKSRHRRQTRDVIGAASNRFCGSGFG
jgi:hypothetical protein